MSTNSYLVNGKKFGWGPKVAALNPDKANLLKKYAKGKCLDVGFGSGIYTQYLHELGHKVMGVDNIKQFVAEANKNHKNIKFVEGEACKLPFKNKEFNTIISFDILEHINDNLALKEFFRVADRVIFSVPHINQKILERYGLSYAHYLDKTHLRAYSLKKVSSLIKKNNLKKVYLANALPISLSGLLIHRLSRGNSLKKTILKIILKPFLPEPNLYSTIFGVLEQKQKK